MLAKKVLFCNKFFNSRAFLFLFKTTNLESYDYIFRGLPVIIILHAIKNLITDSVPDVPERIPVHHQVFHLYIRRHCNAS